MRLAKLIVVHSVQLFFKFVCYRLRHVQGAGHLLYFIDKTPRLLLISACDSVWRLFESSVYSRVASIRYVSSRAQPTICSSLVFVSLLMLKAGIIQGNIELKKKPTIKLRSDYFSNLRT